MEFYAPKHEHFCWMTQDVLSIEGEKEICHKHKPVTQAACIAGIFSVQIDKPIHLARILWISQSCGKTINAIKDT